MSSADDRFEAKGHEDVSFVVEKLRWRSAMLRLPRVGVIFGDWLAMTCTRKTEPLAVRGIGA